ncbi:MAG: helix-turn-helix domain-containing protein [Spirochaetes bacterium]|jgi:AraC-like DNA-binding protein|nr:helix-turn-helix domain-containing protein [Spirochaetota bacterium]
MLKPLIVLIIIVFSLPCAAEPFSPCGSDKSYPDRGVGFYIDKTASIKIEEARKQVYLPLKCGFLKFGHTPHVVWIRMEILKNCPDGVLLEVPKPIIESVSLYRIDKGRLAYERNDVGDAHPFSNREVDHRRIIFNLADGPYVMEYFLRIEAETYINFPLIFWSKKAFEHDEIIQLALIWIYVGLMSILALYNILSYITIRDREHLFIFFLTAGYALQMIAWQGIGLQLIWPETTGWTHILHTTMASYLGIILLYLSKYYLDIRKFFSPLSVLFNFTAAVVVLNVAAVFFFSSTLLYDFMHVVTFTTAVVITVYSLIKALNGARHLWYFLTSIFVFLAGYSIYLSYVWGMINVPLIEQTLIPLMSIIQVVLLSYGLTSKLGVMIRDIERFSRKQKLSRSDALASPAEEKIKKAIEYINSNYRSEISREGLAAECDMNTDYFSRLFKIYTGKKISDYINELRVIEAAGMLRESGENILNIAYNVGFENLRTFNRAFLKVMNVTPSDYRTAKSADSI